MNIVVDTNIILAVVIPLDYSAVSTRKIYDWKSADSHLCAPVLWEYEAASALRWAVTTDYLDAEKAEVVLVNLLRLGIESFSPTPETHINALRWAERVAQTKAYDAQFLSLAEEIGAPFWTADRRLANAAREAGAEFVHWIGGEGG